MWASSIVLAKDPGLHEFVYRWGQSFARFDDEKIQVGFGPVSMKQAPAAAAPEPEPAVEQHADNRNQGLLGTR